MYSDRNFNIREEFIAKPEPEYSDSVQQPDLVDDFVEMLDSFFGPPTRSWQSPFRARRRLKWSRSDYVCAAAMIGSFLAPLLGLAALIYMQNNYGIGCGR